MYGCPSRRASHPPLWAATRISAEAPTKWVIKASELKAPALNVLELNVSELSVSKLNGPPPDVRPGTPAVAPPYAAAPRCPAVAQGRPEGALWSRACANRG
ncbi:hypothetical protein GCM10010330_51610 [Streptomyces tendae]|nr:hypothetical protein GCM10010330_51610 [Streptomyces tendae]